MKLRMVSSLAVVAMVASVAAASCNLFTGADDIDLVAVSDSSIETAGEGGAGASGGASFALGGSGPTGSVGGAGGAPAESGGTGGGSTSSGGAGGSEAPVEIVAGHECTVTDPNGTGNEPGGIIPVCCAPTTSEQTAIERVFVLLNQHRQAHGLAPVTYDTDLEAPIQAHCLHMSLHSFYAHDAPEPSVSSPWPRSWQCGSSASAELIAAGNPTPESVMAAWINSPGHNGHMLNPEFTRVGIGRAAPYWGQMFGR